MSANKKQTNAKTVFLSFRMEVDYELYLRRQKKSYDVVSQLIIFIFIL